MPPKDVLPYGQSATHLRGGRWLKRARVVFFPTAYSAGRESAEAKQACASIPAGIRLTFASADAATEQARADIRFDTRLATVAAERLSLLARRTHLTWAGKFFSGDTA